MPAADAKSQHPSEQVRAALARASRVSIGVTRWALPRLQMQRLDLAMKARALADIDPVAVTRMGMLR